MNIFFKDRTVASHIISQGRRHLFNGVAMCVLADQRFSNQFAELSNARYACASRDTIKMEFLLLITPPERWMWRQIGIVDAGKGRLGLLTLGDAGSRLDYIVRQN
jgi:hypothetical protein